MQEAGVRAIENMYMVIVLNMVHDISLVYLSAESNTVTQFEFVQIRSVIWSFSHSLMNNPNIMSNKDCLKGQGDVFIVSFLLNRFKLVLNETYLTWLHILK